MVWLTNRRTKAMDARDVIRMRLPDVACEGVDYLVGVGGTMDFRGERAGLCHTDGGSGWHTELDCISDGFKIASASVPRRSRWAPLAPLASSGLRTHTYPDVRARRRCPGFS